MPTGYDYVGEAIWDGGGTDLIDASSYTGNSTLDLREGLNYATIIGQTKIWNAFGANIENATGGSGNDNIYGNDLNNTLLGNGGAAIL